ncbi:MAG TPA: serine/threonine-protein kinase [Solirubrobacterales bacterium]
MIGEGEVLAERYELAWRLGSGGMGTVWAATDLKHGGEVAVKVLAEHLSQEPGSIKRFRREARALSRLSHPNIVPIHDSGVDRGRHYIVMELIEGSSVFELLRREGALSPESAVSIGAQVCAALDYAHGRRVIHRDIKPGNLMVLERPEMVVKVTDFGIARLLDETRITVTGSIQGSVPYLAPEHARGEAPTPATDVYALGVVLYECLASQPPYEGGSLPELIIQQQSGPPIRLSARSEGVQPALEAVVMRALEPDPKRRYASAAEFSEELRYSVGLGDATTLPLDAGGEPTEQLERTTAPTVLRPLPPPANRSGSDAQSSGDGVRRRPHGGLALLAIAGLALLGILLLSTRDNGGSPKVAEKRDRPAEEVESPSGEEVVPMSAEEEAPAPKEEAPKPADGATTTRQEEPAKGQRIHPSARSRYSGGGYNADLVSVTRSPNGFDVRFVARGASDLRKPDTSCVEVGRQRIPPSSVRLAAARSGFYEGTLSFSYGAAGDYRFRYSCRKDYSAVFLFARSKATPPIRVIGGRLGTSRYDRYYSAKVGPVEVYPSWFVVEFESNGFSDLRHPRESCVKHDGRTIPPLSLRLSIELSTRYRGEMMFPYEGPGLYQFLYSCQPDYSLVTLFRS